MMMMMMMMYFRVKVIRANGPLHVLFFVIVIFMGSFYLVNLILAIVAMSYDDCQKQDLEDEEAEEDMLVGMRISFNLVNVCSKL